MVYLLLLFLLISSCGIKADTQVLLLPKVEVRRIGDYVYLSSIEDQIMVEGFDKKGDVFYKKDPKPFCFKVTRINGRSKKLCVEEALRETPKIILSDDGDSVTLKASGFEKFALYPYVDGNVDLLQRTIVSGEYQINKDYIQKCYALTGIAGSRESLPKVFCVDGKPKPHVDDVESLEYREVGDRLFLIWTYGKDYQSFLVFQDDSMIGETMGFLFETQKPNSPTSFKVVVKTKEGFLSNGKRIIYSP